MQAASLVVFAELAWSPGEISQASTRHIHRDTSIFLIPSPHAPIKLKHKRSIPTGQAQLMRTATVTRDEGSS